MKPRIARLAKLCQEIGWHLDFLTPGWLVSELMPVLRALPIEFTVAHMGLFPAKDGPGQRGFQEFLKLAGDGSKRCWVKLTGIYRFSTAPGFADVKPIAQALMQTAPDQLIWGSDFPHLSFHDRVGTIQLYNLLGEWAPDAAMRKRILVDNPARLFGFQINAHTVSLNSVVVSMSSPNQALMAASRLSIYFGLTVFQHHRHVMAGHDDIAGPLDATAPRSRRSTPC